MEQNFANYVAYSSRCHGKSPQTTPESQNNNWALYRDDGLIVLQASKREYDIVRKKLQGLFAEHGLEITPDIGNRKLDCLNITLNL